MQEESRCFPAFKRSPLYIKLLIELDLLQDGQNNNSNGTSNLTSKPENGTTTEGVFCFPGDVSSLNVFWSSVMGAC